MFGARRRRGERLAQEKAERAEQARQYRERQAETEAAYAVSRAAKTAYAAGEIDFPALWDAWWPEVARQPAIPMQTTLFLLLLEMAELERARMGEK